MEPDAYDRGPRRVRHPEVATSLGIQADDRVAAIVAVLRPEKDHATFLRAGRLVIDRLPNAKLLVVGDGPLRAELEALADELSLGNRVIFAGMRSDLAEVLSVVDVIVLSSYTVECFPFAVLEAASARVPAVCTAIGGLPELVEHGATGYLVPPHDPAGLADAMARVLGSDDKARTMREAARRRLEERFTLRMSVDETERVLGELVAAATGD